MNLLMNPPAARADIVKQLSERFKSAKMLLKMIKRVLNGDFKPNDWNDEHNQGQVVKFLWGSVKDVHDPDGLLPLLHGVIERLLETHLTNLLEPAVSCGDMGSAIEMLWHSLSDEITTPLSHYTDYAVDMANWVLDLDLHAWI